MEPNEHGHVNSLPLYLGLAVIVGVYVYFMIKSDKRLERTFMTLEARSADIAARIVPPVDEV